MKPIDKIIYRVIASQRAVMKMNVKVASKMQFRRSSLQRRGEDSMTNRILTVTIDHFGGVQAMAR